MIVSQYIPADFNVSKSFHINHKVAENAGNLNIKSGYIEDKSDKGLKFERMLVSKLEFGKKRDGSLLDMFESPLFDVHMVLKYLHSQNRVNIIQYLMNKLYREYINDVKILDFYLP